MILVNGVMFFHKENIHIWEIVTHSNKEFDALNDFLTEMQMIFERKCPNCNAKRIMLKHVNFQDWYCMICKHEWQENGR